MDEDLTNNMGTTTTVSLMSQQSALRQRLTDLHEHIVQHVSDLQKEVSLSNQFQEAFDAVSTFLRQAGETLSEEDPKMSAELSCLQDRLAQLRQLFAQFEVSATVSKEWFSWKGG